MKVAEDYYPITTTKFPPNELNPKGWEQVYITPEHLKDYTKPAEYGSLMNYLMGSTMYLEGYYLCDVEGWLNKRPQLD
jgi:hypothetical protein